MNTLPRSMVLFVSMFTILVFVFQATPLAAGGQSAALTNDDVIKMVQANLSDGIIVAKIKSSACNFDTSTDELIKLKQQRVSDAVIQAMAECVASPAAPSARTPTATAAGPVSEIGIYLNDGGQWNQMDPEVVNVKSGGVGKTLLSGGLVKPDINGHITGGHSGYQLHTPVEILIFVPERVGITEYQLLHLHEQKDSREFRTMTGGVMHVSSGATRDMVQFESKKIANRTYTIELDKVERGEYGFLPPGAVLSSSGGSVGKMYTFGVSE